MSLLAFHCIGSIVTTGLVSILAAFLIEHEGDAGPGSYTNRENGRLNTILWAAIIVMTIHLIETTIYVGLGRFDG